MFGRRSKPPTPTPEAIERKADSMRPGATPEPFGVEEVTGVIDLAIARLEAAQAATTSAIEKATRELQAETAEAIALARRMSHPPRD